MTGPLAQAWQLISDWALLLVAGLGTGAATLSGVVYRTRDRSLDNEDRSKTNQRTCAENERRSKRNEQRIEGDPDNPNHDSLMGIAAENNERLDEMERTQERILRTVDSIADELDGTFYRGGGADDD